jgi:hypothetical protein
MPYATHSLERTSPKGRGQKFLGRCIRCGMTDLPASAAFDPCENHARVSDDEALLLAIRGPST